MKNLLKLLFLAVFSFSTAQTNDFSLKAENLKGKIAKVETKTYTIDKKVGNYILSATMYSKYNPQGFLTLYENESLGDYGSKGSYSYYYNKDNQVIFSDMNFENQEPERTIYKYESGKLVEVTNAGKYGYVSKFEYDKNKNLLKEKTVKSDGETVIEMVYEDYKNNDNYKREKIQYYKGEKTSVVVFELKNGKTIVERYIAYNKGKTINDSHYTYKYDQFGNEIEKKLSINEFPVTSDFMYDKNDNIIKTHTRERTIIEKNFIHYFSFTKYTYEDGKTTGSTEFDKGFAQKFGQ